MVGKRRGCGRQHRNQVTHRKQRRKHRGELGGRQQRIEQGTSEHRADCAIYSTTTRCPGDAGSATLVGGTWSGNIAVAELATG
jgi:hypothetical protein